MDKIKEALERFVEVVERIDCLCETCGTEKCQRHADIRLANEALKQFRGTPWVCECGKPKDPIHQKCAVCSRIPS